MKPGVFTQLYIHIIFSPKYRERLLIKEIRNRVFSYISGIITNRGHKSIIVNGMSDHIHILIGENPNDKISDLMTTEWPLNDGEAKWQLNEIPIDGKLTNLWQAQLN